MNLFIFAAPPTFTESQFKANIVGKNDSEHTRTVGSQQYAPRYPTYSFMPSAPPHHY